MSQITGFLNTMRIDRSEAQHGYLAKLAVGWERCPQPFARSASCLRNPCAAEEIHEHIVKRDSAQLSAAAFRVSVHTRQSGWSHIKDGTTTLKKSRAL